MSDHNKSHIQVIHMHSKVEIWSKVVSSRGPNSLHLNDFEVKAKVLGSFSLKAFLRPYVLHVGVYLSHTWTDM